MDVLIDTNIILNFVTGRDNPYAKESEKIMEYAVEGYFCGFVAIHSISTIWYILRKQKDETETRKLMDRIANILTVANISHKGVKRAIENKNFRDFEDCLQDECAFELGADYLVTCNDKDFYTAKTKVLKPDKFLEIF